MAKFRIALKLIDAVLGQSATKCLLVEFAFVQENSCHIVIGVM